MLPAMQPNAATDPSIPTARRQAVERYADLVRRTFGERAVALEAIGPALCAERAAEPIDSVLLLADDDLAPLRALGVHGKALAADGIAAPLALSLQAIERARDTFPLELMDIAQRRVRILGDDRFTGLAFEREHVRLQCERELRTVLIAMRQRALRSAGDEAGLAPSDLAEQVARVMRGLLHLRSLAAPPHPLAVMGEVERVYARDLGPLRRAWTGTADWAGYQELYALVRDLGALVDAA